MRDVRAILPLARLECVTRPNSYLFVMLADAVVPSLPFCEVGKRLVLRVTGFAVELRRHATVIPDDERNGENNRTRPLANVPR